MKRTMWMLMAGVALLAGCSTLPAPRDAASTMVLVPIEFTKTTSYQVYGHMTMTIRGGPVAGFSRDYALPPSAPYIVIPNLPPGSYEVTEAFFEYKDSGRKGHKQETSIGFELEAGRITFLPSMMRYWMEQVAGKNQWITYSGWDTLSTEKAKDVLRRLDAEKNYPLWELSAQTRYLPAVRAALATQ